MEDAGQGKNGAVGPSGQTQEPGLLLPGPSVAKKPEQEALVESCAERGNSIFLKRPLAMDLQQPLPQTCLSSTPISPSGWAVPDPSSALQTP